jgi:hypothetical protein
MMCNDVLTIMHNIALKKEQVLVTVASFYNNKRQIDVRSSDTRHVQTGIINCCQPAITTFRKSELTVGSLWRQGHLDPGEHRRNFRPFLVEGKNPPDK